MGRAWPRLSKLSLPALGLVSLSFFEQAKHWHQLSNLDLNCNKFDRNGFQSMVAISASWPLLQSLDLSGCTGLGYEGVEAVARAAKEWNLKTLNLNLVNVGSEGMNALGSTARLCDQIEELDLGDNALESHHMQLLCSGCWKTLHSLHLDENQLGVEGMIELCSNGVDSLPSLTFLNIGGCEIGSKGVDQLAKFVKHRNFQLTTLIVDHLNDDDRNNLLSSSYRNLKIQERVVERSLP
jgi:Ran GTPase-activating protein (RanGAP) involved in mRNA processing and transport